MRRVSGRSFKITKNQAKGYGYAKARRMHSNPGVTTIAAINGRGAYGANRSARSVMSKLKQNARKGVARRHLTAAQKQAFKARMAAARKQKSLPRALPKKLSSATRKRHARFASRNDPHRFAPNRSTSASQSQSSRSNIKKAQRARKAWGRKIPRGKRVRVGAASYGRKPRARKLRPGVYVANRRKKAGTSPMAKRRRKSATGATKKRRRSSKRRRKTSTKSAAPRRRRRKAKAVGSKRRKRVGAKRRRRSSKKLTANRRRRHRRNRSKAAAPRRRKAKAGSKRRSSRRRKSTTGRKRRRTSSKRRVSRRRKKSTLKANGRRRRSHRRNKAHRANPHRRRRAHRKNSSSRRGHKANRRRHRRNGRRLRMNGVMDVVKIGAVMFGGFALHRVISNLMAKKVIPMLMPATAPAATSGFDNTNLAGLAVNLGTAALTGFALSKIIKNPETRKLLIGGVVVSAVQTLISSLLQKFAPVGVADALSGPEDGTAARLSAMYGMRGLNGGASIMPHYAAINGMGEYFATPMNGLGEYFREPVSGLGEYIAATSGLGSPYEANSDLYQAAAGFGAQDYQGNHIDPSGDLDRQLTIAEAAAGVGALSPFEAAAGIGPMQAAAGMRGFGAIDTVPSGDTWIPGTTNPQLWAGTRSISEPQSATEMVPAGTLQSAGGQGIFG